MPRFSAHLGYLFTEIPLSERFAAAAAAGFSAVEHPEPYGFGVEQFADACERHGLSVAQIAAPAGNSSKGEKGLACLSGRQDDFRVSVEDGIKAAKRTGSPLLHVLPGLLTPDQNRSDVADLYIKNITFAADACAAEGLGLIIEAISDETIAGFFVNHPDYALDLIAAIGRPNVTMLFDTYHAAVKNLDPVAYIESHLEHIGHIQIADHPGRHEPFTGNLEFDRFFESLDAAGYEGFVGCEYKPKGPTEDGLNWMKAYLHT